MIRDWFDYAGFIVNVVAAAGGLFGLFLAIVAYRSAKEEGRKSRELVAHERRTQFELEVLRDLLDRIDVKDGLVDRLAVSPAMFKYSGLKARMDMLPDEDLPLWREAEAMTKDALAVRLGYSPSDAFYEVEIPSYPGMTPVADPDYVNNLRDRLTQDVHQAIRRRIPHAEVTASAEERS